jgi:outer membrane protein assembly factor BamB
MIRGVLIAGLVAGAIVMVAQAQGGRGNTNWPTSGGDAQRTSWMRTEPKLSAAAFSKAGVQLLWKTKLDTQSGRPTGISQPLLLQNIISHKGFKALAFVATTADVVYAIDYDLNRVYWKQPLSSAARGGRNANCAAGPPAITRAASVLPPGMGAARGGPGGAGPGAPGRGPGGPQPPNRGGINPNSLPINSAVYAVSSGGMLHFLNPHIGQDIQPAIKFLPPGANVAGLIQLDNVLYAATADTCGGSPGVWAIDLASDAKTITRWESTAGRIVGTTGPAFGLDGTVFVAASNSVVGLEPKSLKLRDQFTASTPFTTAPIAFRLKDRDLLAVGNSDGRVYLLDAKSLAGAPVATSAAYGPLPESPLQALATWEDSGGTRWILAPSRTAVVAFKVIDQGGTLSLDKGWTSRDVGAAGAPTILNDVVFVVGGGRSAVLYALDGRTGSDLWNSGTAMTGLSNMAPAAGDSQIYVSGNDGTLYAFGLPMEH